MIASNRCSSAESLARFCTAIFSDQKGTCSYPKHWLQPPVIGGSGIRAPERSGRDTHEGAAPGVNVDRLPIPRLRLASIECLRE